MHGFLNFLELFYNPLLRWHILHRVYTTILAEALKQDGIASYEDYLQRVREDLAREDFAEAYQVRLPSHPRGADFLEFLEHSRAVVRGLVKHAMEAGALSITNKAADAWKPQCIKFVCVDLGNKNCSTIVTQQ